jgi:hypothetical protein
MFCAISTSHFARDFPESIINLLKSSQVYLVQDYATLGQMQLPEA